MQKNPRTTRPFASGQAVITPGAKLKARYVIHTVGPVWQGGNVNEPQILESCYCHSMEAGQSKDCDQRELPFRFHGSVWISGDGGGANSVTGHRRSSARTKSVKLVRFVLFDERTYKAYAAAAEKLSRDFPHYQIKAWKYA